MVADLPCVTPPKVPVPVPVLQEACAELGPRDMSLEARAAAVRSFNLKVAARGDLAELTPEEFAVWKPVPSLAWVKRNFNRLPGRCGYTGRFRCIAMRQHNLEMAKRKDLKNLF